MRLAHHTKCLILVFLFLLVTISSSFPQKNWRSLSLEPENRCFPYDKDKQYPYPQTVEDKIVAQMGGEVYGPYTGRYFSTDIQTDVEHIVSASEGHDSGLCSASKEQRVKFATDLLNLTLAAPEVNRCRPKGKCGLDAAEWLPPKNKCWFANRILEVKTKYSLSVDQAEADTLDSILDTCESFEMIIFPKTGMNVMDTSTPTSANALVFYDDNSNGRISCSEARSHGIAPVMRVHAAYSYMIDGDSDGKVCE